MIPMFPEKSGCVSRKTLKLEAAFLRQHDLHIPNSLTFFNHDSESLNGTGRALYGTVR